jgi:hypothetical protein
LSGGGTPALGGSVTINNDGVTSVAAGTGISVSASTGGVTITNTIPGPIVAGQAKAWVTFVGSSGATNASYNVSSVTRSSAGVYVINYTSAFTDANYCVLTASDFSGISTSSAGKALMMTAQTTTTTSITYAGSVGSQDVTLGYVACFR